MAKRGPKKQGKKNHSQQQGGFLPLLLGSLAGSLLPTIIDKIRGKGIKRVGGKGIKKVGGK